MSSVNFAIADFCLLICEPCWSDEPGVWLAQCLCESNQSLPNRKLVESAKAEQQRIRIRTPQCASIDSENLNSLGRRQLFRLS